MKTIISSLICFTIFPLAYWAQGNPTIPEEEVEASDNIANGSELVHKAVASLTSQPSLAANLRYSIDLYGQQMVGSGSYLQLGSGEDKLLRLTLRLQVGERISSLQQVCDGRFLWIHRDLADESALTRVDLERVRAAVEEGGTGGSVATASDLAWGGVDNLLVGMAENFEFATPQRETIQGIPCWSIEGRWRLEKIRAMLPDQADSIDSHDALAEIGLPPHLPLRVRLALGVEDLFPYRIEYLQREEGRGGELKPIVAVQFFAVEQGVEIDPLQFVYQPGESEVVDRTDRFIQGLQR